MVNFLVANWPLMVGIVVMLAVHRAMGCGTHSHHKTREPREATAAPQRDTSDLGGAR